MNYTYYKLLILSFTLPKSIINVNQSTYRTYEHKTKNTQKIYIHTFSVLSDFKLLYLCTLTFRFHLIYQHIVKIHQHDITLTIAHNNIFLL